MGMKNPVHPGEPVRANLEELGLSVAEAAGARALALRLGIAGRVHMR
jgi:plasmid maintenance system antidote protein VapI